MAKCTLPTQREAIYGVPTALGRLREQVLALVVADRPLTDAADVGQLRQTIRRVGVREVGVGRSRVVHVAIQPDRDRL